MRKLVFLLAAIMLAAGFLFVGIPAPAAHASTGVGGTIQCVSGNNVEGIWVAASSGTSGWAWMDHASGTSYITNWSYTLTSGSTYSVHVGCGGSPSRWSVVTTSDVISGYHFLTCYDNPYNVPPAYQYKCA